jgi:hypothetical protein
MGLSDGHPESCPPKAAVLMQSITVGAMVGASLGDDDGPCVGPDEGAAELVGTADGAPLGERVGDPCEVTVGGCA